MQSNLENYKASLVDLKRLKQYIKELYVKHQSIKANHISCYLKLRNLQNNYLNALQQNDDENFIKDFNIEINPYTKLLNWVIQECLEVKSIMDSIEKIFEIQKIINDLQKKIHKKKDKVKNIEHGKHSISAMFESRPAEEVIIRENYSINDMENTTNCLDLLRNITGNQITFNIIPEFNASKKEKYYHYLARFSEESLKCFSLKPIS